MRWNQCIQVYDLFFSWYKFEVYTSSTAQGGGGSFKNRKPIGELGCCESGMAERKPLMDRKVLEVSSLSVFL